MENPANEQHNKFQLPALPLIEGNKKIKEIKTLEDQAQLTSLYTQRAVDFIKKNKAKPFFFYLAHSMPHVPIAASGKFKGKSKAGLFGDVMEEIDWSVGEVMKALNENNLSNNTLVIFTSDNGPWLNYGNHAGSSGGFREGKGTAWEGGMRVPCIMRWKNKITTRINM
jgi:arylsulfatase